MPSRHNYAASEPASPRSLREFGLEYLFKGGLLPEMAELLWQQIATVLRIASKAIVFAFITYLFGGRAYLSLIILYLGSHLTVIDALFVEGYLFCTLDIPPVHRVILLKGIAEYFIFAIFYIGSVISIEVTRLCFRTSWPLIRLLYGLPLNYQLCAYVVCWFAVLYFPVWRLFKGILLFIKTAIRLFIITPTAIWGSLRYATERLRPVITMATTILYFIYGRILEIQSQQAESVPFRYTPLLGDRDIRLLRLGPQISQEKTSGKLIHISLDNARKYECISYFRGDSTELRAVSLNGREFKVSANVWNILMNRKPGISSRFLWIDAICINQVDEGEKTKQVILMRKIYAKAARVTVWLGNAPDAHLAARLMKNLYIMFYALEEKAWGEHIWNFYLSARKGNGNASPPEWLALRRLLGNPWLERCWAVQEIVLARNVFIVYGGEHIDVEVLVFIIQAFSKEYSTLTRRFLCQHRDDELFSFPVGISHAALIAILRNQYWVQKEPIDFYAILASGVFSRATEPKDKIFALQGLTQAADNFEELPIDYRLSTEEVLLNTAHYFLKRPEPWKAIKMAGYGLDTGPTEFCKEIPSWVTDWTRTRIFESTAAWAWASPSIYKAASEQQAKFIIHSRSVIELSGICIDRIKIRGKIGAQPVDTFNLISEMGPKWMQWLRQAESMAKSYVPDPYFNGQSREEAFWRNCIADHGWNIRPATLAFGQGFLDFKESLIKDCYENEERKAKANGVVLSKEDYLSKDELDFMQQRDEDMRPYLDRMESGYIFSAAIGDCCNGRCFAVTEKGYLAMVPPGTEQGDLVCLVLGADLPFIMRRRVVSIREDGYLLVGECYVHGMVDGEGLNQGHQVETFVLH